MEMKVKTPKGDRLIGLGHPVFIIAEMSANHLGNYQKALKLVDIAVEAGVDAIKIQTYTADTLTLDCDNEYFQIRVNDAWSGQTLHQLYQKAYTPWEWQPKLKEYAESKGVMLFSSPFDETAVDFLEKMKVQIYKIASFETGHIPLLKYIGRTGKPVIMSRGLTPLSELELAITTLKEAGCPQIAVLHCVSSYPAKPEEMNLRTIPDMAQKLDVITGLSDHTLGITVPVASVALGASIIEKHYTLSRAEGGPDAAFSLEPDELKQLVRAVRNAEKALGKPSYDVGEKESENFVFRRSIFVSKDINKGEELTQENLRVIRPGQGMHPQHYEGVLGKKATKNIKKGTPLNEELFE